MLVLTVLRSNPLPFTGSPFHHKVGRFSALIDGGTRSHRPLQLVIYPCTHFPLIPALNIAKSMVTMAGSTVCVKIYQGLELVQTLPRLKMSNWCQYVDR